MNLLPVADALDRLLSRAKPVAASETLPLAEAEGRVLAADLTARLTQPPFNASAMDGYALRREDAPEPGAVLRVIGVSSAGHGFGGSVGQGEAVRIFTGAPVPPGADSVLLQEDAEKIDGGIRTTFPVRQGQHVRPRGQDFAEGEAVLPAGTVLDFSRLTVAAGMNRPDVEVLKRPLIAILATGDELLPPGSKPGPSQIIASNTFGIAALARKAGADVLDLGIVPDDKAEITAAVDRARDAKADVIVTLGGASVGDHDLVQVTLIDAGMQLDFWRIAMRPGKPLMVGSFGETHVLGLPGNPVSSLVCSLLFLEPLIRKLASLPPVRRETTLEAAVTLRANDHRQDYIRARLAKSTTGNWLAEPFGKQDSSMMKVFAQADCLIIRPPHAPELPAGAACPVLLLRPDLLV
ncbi:MULTISPECIES: gephyrin-like molybdotransferase Glp [Rhizobium]|uniref:molybdopterin molybdotransferase MoeA n=1 Tax=Rhizobium TaxID=379 RepID=UPI001B336C92|nr:MULTISPECIES: gephyrin-like molybdotransferase Glp [Rhizobium]MBX4911275.1 molybdopterin molybdotransferase MoeA [Rhizobium bangladeshense]MBX5218430.1 molybdopterin molybdotransferase MoeA [Rhizobium sp. NLR9a]MBX5224460.1 molybdopterin molybdotransferase MoeA [Rhizobium sp. NLR8a]MBX5236402.1 molybdopterin molybdotransferase MoeA [Rhizobium sp. NLR4a]MBX5248467.1 molybdopterin molybdotransferase MoeA [Rhizobium sp. NLR3b]